MAEKKKFNIKSLFVQTEEDPEEVVSTHVATSPTLTSPVMHATTSVATVDPTISASLTKALEDANLPSYDYLEFAEAVDQQASIISDEATRFKSVAMIAKQMGATPEKLVEAANHYLNVLKGKENEFVTAMQDSMGAVNQTEKEIQSIDVRMSELKTEMDSLQEQKKTKIDGIAKNKEKIDQVKAGFYTTLKVFTDKITSDITKINTYLKK
jgi:predicted  nucleic acid-binding Zn-ribbon protein